MHFYLSKVNIEAFNSWHECDSGHIPLYESDRVPESSYLARLIILTEHRLIPFQDEAQSLCQIIVVTVVTDCLPWLQSTL